MTVNAFVTGEVLKIENRSFWAAIIAVSVGYFLVSFWLNGIRATASLWFVWLLIIVQFALYFAIFVKSYLRSVVLGLNRILASAVFIILAVLGRVNDWEIIVIPPLVLAILLFSARNKNVSERMRSALASSKEGSAPTDPSD